MIPERDWKRAQDDLETAKLNYARAAEPGSERQPAPNCAASARRDAQALRVARQQRVDALDAASPVGGIVATLAQVERSQVAENAALVTIVDLSALEIEFQVAESYANEIRPAWRPRSRSMAESWSARGRHLARREELAGHGPRALRRPAQGPASEPARPVRIVLDERGDVLAVGAAPSTIPTPASSTWCATTKPSACRSNRCGGDWRNRGPQWPRGRRHRRSFRHA